MWPTLWRKVNRNWPWVDPDFGFRRLQSSYYKYDQKLKKTMLTISKQIENLKREMETTEEPNGNSKCEMYDNWNGKFTRWAQ